MSTRENPLDAKPVAPGLPAIPAAVITPIPFEDKVIVVIEEASLMRGSFIVPDAASNPPLAGIVVAVGLGVHDRHTSALIPMSVQKGDHVTFSKYSGEDFLVGGKAAKVMRQADLHFRYPRLGEDGYDEYTASYTANQLRNEKIKEAGSNRMPAANLQIVES